MSRLHFAGSPGHITFTRLFVCCLSCLAALSSTRVSLLSIYMHYKTKSLARESHFSPPFSPSGKPGLVRIHPFAAASTQINFFSSLSGRPEPVQAHLLATTSIQILFFSSLAGTLGALNRLLLATTSTQIYFFSSPAGISRALN